MKIRMLKSQPKPGGKLPCYLSGVTYTLAAEAELAMAKGFVEAGHAELLDEAPAEVAPPVPADEPGEAPQDEPEGHDDHE